jgi:hypothetical protein
MSLNRGIRLNGYKMIRKEIGTVDYEIDRKPNVYASLYESDDKHLHEFVEHTRSGPNTTKTPKKNKMIEIKEKTDVLDDLLLLSSESISGGDRKNSGSQNGESHKNNSSKDTESQNSGSQNGDQVGGGSNMKKITVTNINSEPKKNKLIL